MAAESMPSHMTIVKPTLAAESVPGIPPGANSRPRPVDSQLTNAYTAKPALAAESVTRLLTRGQQPA